MKRCASIVALLLLATGLPGCGPDDSEPDPAHPEDRHTQVRLDPVQPIAAGALQQPSASGTLDEPPTSGGFREPRLPQGPAAIAAWQNLRAQHIDRELRARLDDDFPFERVITLILEGLAVSAFEPVGYLISQLEDRGHCTGTLISCDKVLTAAHCFKPDGNGRLVGSNYKLYFQHAGLINISTVVRYCDTAGGECNHDVHDLAIATLRSSPGIAPYELAGAQDWNDGASANIVGFGVSGLNSDRGIKRSGAITPQACRDGAPCLDIAGEHANCSADSGGPMLTLGQPKVLAVAKTGGFCDTATGRYLRVSHPAYADWIARMAAPSPGCERAGLVATETLEGSIELASELETVPLPAGLTNAQANLNFELGFGNAFDLLAPGDATCTALGEIVSCQLPGPYDGNESITVTRGDATPTDSAYQLTLVQQ